MSARDRLLGRMYGVLRAELPAHVTRGAFARTFRDWELFPIRVDGAVVGVVGSRGPRVHILYFERPRGSIQRPIRYHMGRLIDRYGYAETCVEHGSDRRLTFCRRLGFEIVADSGGVYQLRCTRFKYARQS
ncbi:hypothetical protein [Burkholderia cenocepacia]|uniref:hypothetical protein n=1 Tax=Burkholderia cenocepacia TaxID=95486 RepID=UPI0022391253|nr:hypothetical protein [Burkholderia cenocepacia]MCW5141059.1 hypothetical protein [Burkholderia cenocepacia]